MKPKRRSPARKDTLLRRFEKTAGTANVTLALQCADDPRAEMLLAMMFDTAYRHHSFARLCEKVGLRYRDVFELFRRAKLDLALLALYDNLPDIARDVAEEALSWFATCKTCAGEGQSDNRLCHDCDGSGKVRITGDPECRRIVLRATGICGANRAR